MGEELVLQNYNARVLCECLLSMSVNFVNDLLSALKLILFMQCMIE